MKKVTKISLTCAIVAFTITFVGMNIIIRSCNDSNKDKIEVVGDTVSSEGKVMEFEYQNHKFINIVKMNDDKEESFVVHDPNCKCMTKKLNNITTVITNTDNHNTYKSDSISKANFRVIISKLSQLSSDNAMIAKEVKTLRTEVAMLKKMKTNPVWKVPVKATSKPTKKAPSKKK